MEPNRQKLGLLGIILLLATVAAGVVLALITRSLSAHVAVAFAGMGFLVAVMSWFQMHLEERERLEKLELDELNKDSKSALFNTSEAESMLARKTRLQFEKYWVPAFTVLLLLAQAGAAWGLWRWLSKPTHEALDRPMLLMAVFAMFFLFLFLLGQYISGIVRLEKNRLLRPAAGFILLNAYICLVVAGAMAAHVAGLPRADSLVAYALCIILGLASVETLITLLLEGYRPRVAGKEVRVLYDSRLVGLLSQPEGVLTTMAHAMDYQFGFKVSETWFYQFLQRSLAWIILSQVALLFLSTCIVIIDSGEQGILERLGRPVPHRSLLNPGLHIKYPWPIDIVQKHRTEQFQTFMVGVVEDDKIDQSEPIVWAKSHYKEEFNMLVASRNSATNTTEKSQDQTTRKIPPVSLLAVNIPVQFQITNLTDWTYNHTDSAALLEKLAMREVTRYLASADVSDLMIHREQAGALLRNRIQEQAEEARLGVRIAFVGVAGIHPPVAVAEAYEKVISMRQTMESEKLKATAFASETNTLAEASAHAKKQAAETDKRRMQVSSAAQAALFTNQIPAFTAEPSVYAMRTYLQTLIRNASGVRKYVLLTTNTHDVLQFNLEEKITTGMLDAAAPQPPAPKD